MSDSDFSIKRQLDVNCDEFENQWSADHRTDIKQFLEQVADEHREQLLPMLLEIDVELRQKANQEVSAADYAQLGEQAVLHVDGLLATAGNNATIPPLELHSPESTTKSPQVAPSASSNQIGPYKLLRQIGEGGMGTVWMAEQREPVKRRVALKLIRADIGSKESIARFEAERQALAMMDHQNIAKVLDAGTTESGSPYFVMELVKGVPLNEYCDNNKLSVPARLGLMVDVCKAIQHAHQKGIIHRDLKPSNVLVTESDGKAIPKVIDFGLAKALEHTHRLTDKTLFTEFGKVVGTLQYMSPEQAEMDSLDIDTRTDIYSLGVMLYELLTGSTPLDKETLGRNALLQVLALIREKEPERPSSRLSSSSSNDVDSISEQRKIAPSKLKQILTGDLDWIVMKALEKDRGRRYESANGFADDIERFLNDEAVRARPPSTSYRARKFIKKNRLLVTYTSAIVALLITGIAFTSWFAIKAESARKLSDLKTNQVTLEKEKSRTAELAAKESERTAKTEAENARQATKAAIDALKKAEYQSRISMVNSLVADSRMIEKQNPIQAIRMAMKAAKVSLNENEPILPNVRVRLYELTSRFGGVPLLNESGDCAPLMMKDGTVYFVSDEGLNSQAANGEHHKVCIENDNLGVTSLVSSPNEKWVVANTGHKGIIAWKHPAGSETLKTIVISKQRYSRNMKFSSDGEIFSSEFFDYDTDRRTIQLWKVADSGFELNAKIDCLDADARSKICKIDETGTWICKGFNESKKAIVLGKVVDGEQKEFEIKVEVEREPDDVIFDPKGKWIAISGQGYCLLGDLCKSGIEEDLFKLVELGNALNSVHAIAFSPDGNKLVVSVVSTLRSYSEVWKLNDTKFEMHSSISKPCTEARFTSNGNELITWSSNDAEARGNRYSSSSPIGDSTNNGIISIWDYDYVDSLTQKRVGRLVDEIMSARREFDIAPDNQSIAVVSTEGEVQQWRWQNQTGGWKKLPQFPVTFIGVEDKGLITPSFDPTGDFLVVDSKITSVGTGYSSFAPARIWNLKRRSEELSSGGRGTNMEHAFISQGGWLVDHPAGGTGDVRCYQLGSNQMHTFEEKPKVEPPKWLIGKRQLFDLSIQNPFDAPLEFKSAGSGSVIPSDSGKYACIFGGQPAEIVDLSLPPDHSSITTLPLSIRYPDISVFSDDDRWLLTSHENEDNEILLWQWQSEPVVPISLTHTRRISGSDAVSFFMNARRVVAHNRSEVVVWAVDGKSRKNAPLFQLDSYWNYVLSTNKQWLVTHESNGVYLFDLHAKNIEQSKIKLADGLSNQNHLDVCDFSGSDNRLVLLDGNLCYSWQIDETNVNTDPICHRLGDKWGNFSPAPDSSLSTNGKWMAFVEGGIVWLCDLESKQATPRIIRLKTELEGPMGSPGVYGIKISRDSRWLATRGGLAKVWDLNARDIQSSGFALPVEPGEVNPIFSHNSDWIVAYSQHYENSRQTHIRAWRLNDQELLSQTKRLVVPRLSGHDANRINRTIWKEVKRPYIGTNDAAISDQELNLMREVIAEYPTGHRFNTLGAAEFRMGNFKEAIAAALKSIELLPKEDDRYDGPFPGDYAILAMSHYKLGDPEKANQFRAQLTKAMKLDALKDDPECKSFVDEVNTVFASQEAENSSDNN